ncbi:SagB/ThcOx family dehydrogenase [Melghirimyces profundicolus]|uniref:SagB/ThcOx family dehydrogenase n=1 Tax=Melghirimyces profundicolus TaxID=1242148 RepID=UPI001474BF96|nr:SagB/ThcOx family dehydrogenase [Melghirimyces profundicolus]
MISLETGKLKKDSLTSALTSRRSPKEMKPVEGLAAGELGPFLEWSLGSRAEKRMYPSAGSRYPNRIFISIRHVDGLSPGLYEYLPDEHSLIPGGGSGNLAPALVQPDLDFNFCLVIAADLPAAAQGYGFRGYRFTLMEAGHMVQNLQLAARAMDWDAAPVGGFLDRPATEALGLKGKGLSPLYLVPVGVASE